MSAENTIIAKEPAPPGNKAEAQKKEKKTAAPSAVEKKKPAAEQKTTTKKTDPAPEKKKDAAEKAIVAVPHPKAKRAISKRHAASADDEEAIKKTTLHKLVKVILQKMGGEAADLHVSANFVDELELVIRKGMVGVISMSNHISAYKGLRSTDGEAIVNTVKIIEHIKQNPDIMDIF